MIIFKKLRFIGFVQIILLRALFKSSFGFRAREDWFFGGVLYLVSIGFYLPSLKWLTFIVSLLCIIWCLFIWFFYRLPYDFLESNPNKFFEKNNLKIKVIPPNGKKDINLIDYFYPPFFGLYKKLPKFYAYTFYLFFYIYLLLLFTIFITPCIFLLKIG